MAHNITRLGAARRVAGTSTARLTLPVFWAALAEPLAIALVAHAAILLVGWLAFWLVPHAEWLLADPRRPHALWEAWIQWDAGWYATIASAGYTNAGPNAPTVAFWPLLPLLTALLAQPFLALGTPSTVAVAGAVLALNTLAFAAAAVLLHRLLLETLGREAARRGLLLLSFAPGAVFLVAGYPEALLLIGVVGCFLALHRGQWALAGLAGAWAAAAHVPGCLLVLPVAWAYLARERRLGAGLIWALLIPLPPALWLGYLGLSLGDPLAPIHAADRHWQHVYAWPWTTLLDGASQLLSGPMRERPLLLLNFLYTLLTLASAVWAFRTGRGAWGIWVLLLLALYLSLPAAMPLDGLLRYTLSAVPLWALLGRLRLPEGLLVAPSALVAGLLTALFINGYWVA